MCAACFQVRLCSEEFAASPFPWCCSLAPHLSPLAPPFVVFKHEVLVAMFVDPLCLSLPSGLILSAPSFSLTPSLSPSSSHPMNTLALSFALSNLTVDPPPSLSLFSSLPPMSAHASRRTAHSPSPSPPSPPPSPSTSTPAAGASSSPSSTTSTPMLTWHSLSRCQMFPPSPWPRTASTWRCGRPWRSSCCQAGGGRRRRSSPYPL